MCVGDYRIDRLVKSVLHHASLTNVGFESIPANRQRVGLVFGVTASSFANVDIMVDGTFRRFYLTSGASWPTTIVAKWHGDLATKEYRAQLGAAGPAEWVWVEMILPESVLYKLPEELTGKL